MRVLSNAQLDAEQERHLLDEEEQDSLILQGIALHISKCWAAARTQKQQVRDRIFRSQRARRGEYDPQKLAHIRETGGSEEYGRVTSNKCKVAESWLRDVYLGQAERAWTIKPTPDPELPPEELEKVEELIQKEIMEAVAMFNEAPAQGMIQGRRNEVLDAVRLRVGEEARLAIERMEQQIADQLTECGWADEWADFLNDFATYPAAHFKGPIVRRRTELKWVEKNGKWTSRPKDVFVPTVERVDPMRCYPSPDAITPQDGFFIEHITLSRQEVFDLIGLDGFNEEAIRSTLTDGEGGHLTNWLGLTDSEEFDAEIDRLTYLSPDFRFDVLEYHGPIMGRDLIDWGMEGVDDAENAYEVCAWLVGRNVIKATLNDDPLARRPYYKACWEEVPGEYWGQSLPDTLYDVQGVVNAAIRSLVNNMSMASGPQAVINVDRLPPGEEIEGMQPWKIWQVHDSQYGGSGAPIDFFQPNANSAELLNVLERFYTFADDWSLIPRYMQGSGNGLSGGVGRTASGLSMLFNAANKGLKGVVSTIDGKVLSPLIEAMYYFNMMYNDDESIKGDAQVEARGAISLMQLETLQLRRNEFLQATANPVDSQIVGTEGRAEILREVAKGLEMDVNRLIPRRGQVPEAPVQGGAQQPQLGAGQSLDNGGAVTDNFSPNSMTP